MTVTSEMLNGEAIVDGWYHVDLSIGDKFLLTSGPQYALKVLSFDHKIWGKNISKFLISIYPLPLQPL